MSDRPIRRPGSPWRLLVHEWVGRKKGTSLTYGAAHDVSNGERPLPRTLGADVIATIQANRERHIADGLRVDHILPANCEFDELVVGQWLHVEQQDSGLWWMSIAGHVLWVDVDRDGRPTCVRHYEPGEHAERVEGCTYPEVDQ